MNEKRSAHITPLWIIAAFVTLTETVLGYALTKVTGGVQIALTCFVIVFALLVAGGFFLILWNRPYVFYPPSEYASVDPARFIGAIRSALPKGVSEQLELVAEVEKHPSDEEARFALIDSLIDDTFRQHLIVMHERNSAIPYGDRDAPEYVLEMGELSAVQGWLDVQQFVERLEGTGLIELTAKGPTVKLTALGERFAEWLTNHNRKATYFFSPFGQWGTPQFHEFVGKRAARDAETQKPP
jgi:hypothetical protein